MDSNLSDKDIFSICEFSTDATEAEADLRMFLKAGMPADIHLGAVRENLPVDQQGTRLAHAICTHVDPKNPAQMAVAKALLATLFEFGSAWNSLDSLARTPACIAAERHCIELYDLLVSAGVRSELILRRLTEPGETETSEAEPSEVDSKPEENQQDYLENNVRYTNSALVTDQGDGVMMDWETPLMEKHAKLLAPEPGKKVLNIGFGMGIIDGFLQAQSPSEHVIIEAHPKVLAKMDAERWGAVPGVRIMGESWKTALPKLIAEGAVFDGIYYDTFSEHYADMLELFEYVVGLLAFDGVFSYFNGLGADRQVCYDIYKQVAAFDLQQLGLQVKFEDVKVQLPEKIWTGLKRPYFSLSEYALPTVTFAAQAEPEGPGDHLTDEEVFI